MTDKTPATEAGRRLAKYVTSEQQRDLILAIETQARAATPSPAPTAKPRLNNAELAIRGREGLDVERLARFLQRWMAASLTVIEDEEAFAFAAEYARLSDTEPSGTA